LASVRFVCRNGGAWLIDIKWEGKFMSSLLRFKIFAFLKRPFSIYNRRLRMSLFVKIMKPYAEMKVLDLGGKPGIWDYVQVPLHITCLNLPGIVKKNYRSHHVIDYIEGDACGMPDFQFGDFDLIYSNSVIEHVGNSEKRCQFADEIKRLSNKYWIQTPCKGFPVEAHTGMPFWWYYPSWLNEYFINGWSKKLPDWTESIVQTTYVTKNELEQLFPNGKIITEWFVLPKSLIIYSVDANQ